jgi:hypothetical protein
MFSEGAPAHHEERAAFECGESYAPPVLDTVAAGLFGLAALGNATGPRSTGETASGQRQGTIVLAALAALDTASAVYGYNAVGHCRDAKTARAAAVARASVLPPPYGVPPWGAPPSYWPPPLPRPRPVAATPAAPPPAPAAPPPPPPVAPPPPAPPALRTAPSVAPPPAPAPAPPPPVPPPPAAPPSPPDDQPVVIPLQ